MLSIIGLIIIFMGFAAIFFGGREVPHRSGGWILRHLSWPEGKARWLQIPMGAALIFSGSMILLREIPI